MIDRADPRPAYQQVAGAIREAINRGELQPGDRIPTMAQLQDQHSVAYATVQHAIRLLRSQGLIDTAQGVGMTVRSKRPLVNVVGSLVVRRDDGSRETWAGAARQQGMKGWQEITFAGITPGPLDVTDALGLSDGESLVTRRRVLYLDDDPAQLVGSYYPLDVAAGTPLDRPEKIRGGALPLLEAKGMQLDYFRDVLHIRMPSQTEAQELQLTSGVPVARVLRTTFVKDGRPVEVTDMVTAGNRIALIYEFPAVD